MLLQELRPVLVQQRAICLQVVLDPLSRLRMLPLQRHDLAEELDSEQRGFTPLPRKYNLVCRHTLDVVTHEALEYLVVHVPAAGTARQRLLAQVKAVRAVEVARRAGGLDHHMEPPLGTVAQPLRSVVLVDLQILIKRRRSHIASHSRAIPEPGCMGKKRDPSPRGLPLPVEDFAGNTAIRPCLGSTPPKRRTALNLHIDRGWRLSGNSCRGAQLPQMAALGPTGDRPSSDPFRAPGTRMRAATWTSATLGKGAFPRRSVVTSRTYR